MNNIASDKKYEDIKNGLKKKLLDELTKYNDPRVVEKPCRFEKEPYAGKLQEFQWNKRRERE